MSLYQLERDGKTDELVAALEGNDNPTIRRRAAELLGDLAESDGGSPGPDDEESAVEALVEAAQRDSDKRVRAAAIDALDRYGQSALERLVAELAGKDLDTAADWVAARAFVEVLDAGQAELRMAAATGLGRVGDPSATAKLVDRLEDPDPRVRARSATACGRIGDPRAVPVLESRLGDDGVEVRKAAADALGKIGTEGAREALLEFANDENESVRRIVVDALGHFGSLEPVDTLVEALDDDSEAVRRTAMFSLVEILSNAPAQRSHEVRDATADKLESATADEVVPPLVEILTESSGSAQRRNAAWLLGRVVGTQYRERAQAALVETLGDDDGTTAQFAATSLTRLDGPELESQLLDVVDDGEASPDARSKALFVLGKVGGEEAREELGSFVDRTDSDQLREQAFSALSKLGGIGAGDV